VEQRALGACADHARKGRAARAPHNRWHDSGIPFADHWFNFTDAGRHFHVQVGIGESAPGEARERVYRILDRLRFDPNVKPDWPSAG
jgi:hypothetical protein